MDAATTIRRAREQAKLSKRELARRAGTSPAAIVLYEAGEREPSYATLTRIVGAAGFEARLSLSALPLARRADPAVLGRRLVDVLELAEHLPHRRAGRRMAFPPFQASARTPRGR